MSTTLRNLLMAAVLALLLAPLVVVAGVSVNEKKELLFPPRGFSLACTASCSAKPTGSTR